MNQDGYYRVSIKGIVVDSDGSILLSREDNGKWELLGGGLQHGEDPIDCLRREILEETGLQVTYVAPKPSYFLTAQRLGTDTYVANVIYEIQLQNLDFTPSDECVELKFFSPDEMGELDVFPNVAPFRQLLLAERGGAA